jgi:hypothetical protein
MKTSPGDLRRYWQAKPGLKLSRPQDLLPKSLTSGKALERASTTTSLSSSGKPSPVVAGAPTIIALTEAAPSSNEASDPLSETINQGKEQGAPPDASAEAEQPKIKLKKAKKRKRAALEDDIDAIFAGL